MNLPKKPIASLSAEMLSGEPKMSIVLGQDGAVMDLITLVSATILNIAEQSSNNPEMLLLVVAASMAGLDDTGKTSIDLGAICNMMKREDKEND